MGCDKEVGSMKADDKCGVCGGDNSHCRTVKGTLGKASKQAALKLVQIPAGARYIQIETLEKAPHRLVVKNQVTGSFILNPKGKEAVSRTFTVLGLEWEHEVEDAKDSLKTSGPLPEAIAVLPCCSFWSCATCSPSPLRCSPQLRVAPEAASPTSTSSMRTCCPSSGATTCSWRRQTPTSGR